jgi:hypothetical protein
MPNENANENASEKSERDNKKEQLILESIAQAKKVYPDLDPDEARILMIVLKSLWPLLNAASATPEHTKLKSLAGNYNARRHEIRNNPIAEVRSYNPKADQNW